MANYLIHEKSGEHYFYRPYEGICMKRRTPGGSWQEYTQIIALGREPFSVHQCSDQSIHIVCIDAENKLVYAARRNNVWKKYVLSKLSDDIFVSDMHLYAVRGRLNLLYSALYNGENLLIHCILGNHAKPSTVSSLSDSHFFCHKNKVYYTNSEGILGFTDLDDEKPSFFNRLYDDASSVSVWEESGKEFLIFTKNSHLFVNGKKILYDERIKNPILVKGIDRLYIMWKSGGFIRYISSFNGGSTWSEPMRFINTGVSPKLYTFKSGDTVQLYYGYESGSNLTLFGASDIFSAEHLPSESDEIKKIQSRLYEKTEEAENVKKEVERLNKILSELMP